MYNLKITKEQAEIMEKALDLFSRIGTGQFEEILRHPTWRKKMLTGEIKPSAIAIAKRNIDGAKKLITKFDSGASMSIVGASEDTRSAYDILQVIRYSIWQDSDNKEDTAHLVNAQKPMKLADHSLPEMNKCD